MGARSVTSSLLFVLAACARTSPSVPESVAAPPPVADGALDHDAETPVALVLAGSPEASSPAQLDPDGDDDAADPGAGPVPANLKFERVGRPPLSLQRICDLTPLGDALYASHANQPLGTDGATITRYGPDDAKPFTVAFDWNRPGEPTKGGGGGQGFLRVHAIGGRLFVPDADPPYAGFGIAEPRHRGVRLRLGRRGDVRPRGRARPPAAASSDAGRRRRAGAAVLPRAYHVLDVIRFRGRLYASTGSVPPDGARVDRSRLRARSTSPARAWARWTYEVDYPFPWQAGVWRLTYLVRFRDRLYAGIQDYDGREPNDYVVFAPAKDTTAIGHDDARGVRVTEHGAALTLRWYASAGKLWWIAIDRGLGSVLRVTDDGDTWRVIPLPPEAGEPTDVVRYHDAVVALTEWGLWRVDVDPPALLARVDAKRSPFRVDDAFCSAPLAVFRDQLYAGDQRDGSLWRIAPQLPR